jgi:hypothetical protein
VKAVFLDTVGLLALWDVADQWHNDAESAFASLLCAGWEPRQHLRMMPSIFGIITCIFLLDLSIPDSLM